MTDAASGAASPESRRERLRGLLPGLGVDALLVVGPEDLRYLSGFTGSEGALLVTADSATLCTDERYGEQVRLECPGLDVIVDRGYAATLLKDRGVPSGRWGFDAAAVTVAEHAAWRAVVTAPGGPELVPLESPVGPLRVVKDATELVSLRRACAIADTALGDLLAAGGLRAGRTETEVAADLEYRMRIAGSEGPSFETIIASGPNSALPHHRPGSRELADGDLVVVDYGAVVDEYHSDCTRTFLLGAGEEWAVGIHAVVAAAHSAGIAAVRAGVACADVDAAARAVIDDAGYGEWFTHSTGHGVGLAVHEAPRLGRGAAGMLVAGSPVTVEPGIYLPGRGGVRIEDTVVVTEGEPEVLTNVTRNPLVP